jgi:hypothetical protein
MATTKTKKQHDLYSTAKGQGFEDDHLHGPILDAGDHEAAKKVSDAVARDIGLTDKEIEALSTPKKGSGQ